MRESEIRSREIGKLGAQPRRAQHVALARLELAFLRVLEMPRLRLDQQAIDDRTIAVGERAKVHAQPDQRKQVHRLAGCEQVAVLQDAVGAADFVEQLARIGFEQLFARVELMLDDRLQYGAE